MIKSILYTLLFWSSFFIHFTAQGELVESFQPRKLKILVATNIFPKSSETFVMNHIVHLLKQGHDVSIYANKKNKKAMRNVVLQHKIIFKTYIHKIPRDIGSFDIILCQFGMHGKKFAALKTSRNLKAKVVTFFRGNDISRRKYLKRSFYAPLFKQGDLFIPICEFFKRRLISMGAPKEKMVVLHDAIDCTQFSFSSHPCTNDDINLITIARLVEKKGIADALRALQKVVKRFPKTKLTIVGDGLLKSKLQALTKQLALTNNVQFTGWLPPNKIPQLLAQSHIFVLPCRTAKNHDQDGTPNSIIEAMACGLPIVSTSVSGIPEVVQDGRNGFLVPARAPSLLAQKIEYLIEHPEIREDFGREGRTRVETIFNINHNIKILEDIFYELCNASSIYQ